MQTPIRYTTTSDDIRIAYAMSGRGPALLHMPNLGASMLEAERLIPERAAWSELLEERFTLVRYDMRGTGYSQRDPHDVSIEGHLRDLESVIAASSIRNFTLFGFLTSAYIAPFYAAMTSCSASRLILWPPDTRRQSSQEYQSLGQLLTSDWETFTETYAHLALGWEQGEAAHRYARVLQSSVEPQMFLRQILEGRVSMSDAAAAAARVSIPVLVLQRSMRFAAERAARLISAFPDAVLQTLPGDATVPYMGDSRLVVETMAHFAAGQSGPPSDAPTIVPFAPRPSGATDSTLTPREREILLLIVDGLSNREIAAELVLSVRTVERHLQNIYEKIGASGKSARAAAAAFALRQHIG